MWQIPLLISVVLGIVILALQRQDSQRRRRANYRFLQHYRAQIADLDRIRTKLLQIFDKLSQLRAGEAELQLYEKAVTDFERLLIGMRSIPLSSPNFDLIKASDVLIKATKRNVDRLLQSLEGNKPAISATKKSFELTGCYFCSKPAISEPLRRIRVKIDGETRNVLGCLVCRTAMKQNRTAKVLFFNKNGQSVHWSQIEDFKPEESYFLINSAKAKELGRSQLRLVYSTGEKDHE